MMHNGAAMKNGPSIDDVVRYRRTLGFIQISSTSTEPPEFNNVSPSRRNTVPAIMFGGVHNASSLSRSLLVC